jgi:hypothetical protein
MGIEITRAQGAAATMKTVARVSHSSQPIPSSPGIRASSVPMASTAGL